MFTFPVASTKYNVKESAWHANNEKNRQKVKLKYKNEDTPVHVHLCVLKWKYCNYILCNKGN